MIGEFNQELSPLLVEDDCVGVELEFRKQASVEVERVKGNDVLTVYLNPDAVEDAAEQ